MYSSILLTGMAWQAKGKRKFGGCKWSEPQVSKETIPSQKFSFSIKIALRMIQQIRYWLFHRTSWHFLLYTITSSFLERIKKTTTKQNQKRYWISLCNIWSSFLSMFNWCYCTSLLLFWSHAYRTDTLPNINSVQIRDKSARDKICNIV